MKTLVTLLTVVGLFTFTSCRQDTDMSSMLKNPEMRSHMMESIANDHSMMTEFMGKMKENPHAMQMMQGNKEMMNMMMQGNGMQMMHKNMMHNPEMMKNMMSTMMNDGAMMSNMMQMMHDKGMMSDECMKSCMQMMKDKGMEMGSMHNGN
jgi:hypothetical protein